MTDPSVKAFARMLRASGYCGTCGQLLGCNPAVCEECLKARQRETSEKGRAT